MKKIAVIILIMVFGWGEAQTRQVSQKILELSQSSNVFEKQQVFSKSPAQKSTKYLTSVSEVTILDLNEEALNRIVSESPEFISLDIPYLDEEISVVLYKQSVLTDDFYAITESGEWIDYTPGSYYRGIIEGDNKSLAAISFFENEVMGVISSLDRGNIVLGKSVDGSDYLSYSESSLLGENPFVCGADEMDYNQNVQNQISFDPAVEGAADTDNCVRIYYEVAYRPFFLKASNLESTLDWITGIQNNIGAIYENDGMNTLISSIKVWTTKDPYLGSPSQNLGMFQATVTDFDGDVAHLVNNPTTTSVAYLDTLCSSHAYAYSGVAMQYSEVPAYSWTISAMAHEMGHTFGSPHTHSCVWNGDNTPIDGCGNAAGAADPGCSGGPIPEEGGTVMSYCHLVSVGVNLALGFGEQPGALMRNNVATRPCLSNDCQIDPTVCTISIKEIEAVELFNGDIEVSVDDNFSAQWAYQLLPFEAPLTDDWIYVETTEFIIPSPGQNGYFDLHVINVCENGIFGNSKKATIFIGDFCNGELFTDSGGEQGNYRDNQYIVKTFYPTSGHAVNITFDKIRLESNKDFIYIHNGDSTDAPLFSNGTLTGIYNGGPSFTSTHNSGALTFVFVSDENITRQGWEAYVNCSEMSVSDLSDNAGIFVYPNPTDDILNIESQSPVAAYQLTDMTGRMIMTKALNSNKGMLNIGHLTPGTYILTLKLKGKTISQKIIKR